MIERFSEDIDLVIDREILGFPKEFVNNTQLRKLRKAASAFIAGPFRDELEKTLLNMGIAAEHFQLTVQETDVEDRDPQVLVLGYHSCVDDRDEYIAEKVLIEIGARSLREPSSLREIKTILSEVYPEQPYSGKPFKVLTVEPHRTMLEKVFLLHEEFLKPQEKIRHERLSRHLYDLEKLMDTTHGKTALNDDDFYYSIIKHRQEFNAIRKLDYSFHGYARIDFIPPKDIIGKWEADYRDMRVNMIHDENALQFDALIQRLKELRGRFRAKVHSTELKDKMVELKIDSKKLSWLIDRAMEQIESWQKPVPGATFSTPVTIPSDMYKPAGDDNKTETFELYFKAIDGAFVFQSIEKQLSV